MKPVASKGIRFVGHSDMDGRSDGVQIMVHRGFAYVGHGFSNGITTLDVRDPKKPKVTDFIACPPGTSCERLPGTRAKRAAESGTTIFCEPPG